MADPMLIPGTWGSQRLRLACVAYCVVAAQEANLVMLICHALLDMQAQNREARPGSRGNHADLGQHQNQNNQQQQRAPSEGGGGRGERGGRGGRGRGGRDRGQRCDPMLMEV